MHGNNEFAGEREIIVKSREAGFMNRPFCSAKRSFARPVRVVMNIEC